MERPLRIVHVNAADEGGGAERSVMGLHHRLGALGHVSLLLVGAKSTDAPGVVEIPYVRGVPGLRRLMRWVEARTGWVDIYNPGFRRLARLIPRDTDVVHLHNLWGSGGFADWSVIPSITRRWPGVFTERQNWSFTGHCACFHDCVRWRTGCGRCPRLDLPPATVHDGTAFNWRRRRWLVRKSRLSFVGISDHVCALARQSPIWEGKAIARIYNGIDMTVFRPLSPVARKALRARLGIAEGSLVVMMSGQTIEGFREGIAAECFEVLNRLSDPRVVPLLVGRSAAEAAKLLGGRSVAVGYRQQPAEMAECYSVADLALVTSRVEAFGRIAAESQACGTPVVAFDSGGLAEVVVDGVGGLTVRQGDVPGLGAALTRMLDSATLRAECAARGRTFVERTFADELIVREYIRLYAGLMEAGAGADQARTA